MTIIGPSGCGKSTILNLIAHIAEPSRGTVTIDGEPVTRMRPDKISMVFQEAALYPWRTALKNVEFGLQLRGVPSKVRREKAEKYLELVGLLKFKDRYPHELSGGMQQRVSIARALASETDVLLMDEPFGALDEQSRLVLSDQLVSIWQKTGKTILFVTHSLLEAAYLSDRIVVMTSRPGRIRDIMECDIERPRDLESPKVSEIRSKLWKQLSVESKALYYGEQMK